MTMPLRLGARVRRFTALPVLLALLAAEAACGGAAGAPSSVRAAAEPMSVGAPMAPAAGGTAAYPAASPASAPMGEAAPAQPAPQAPGGGAPSAPSRAAAAADVKATATRPADARSAKNAGPTARAPVIIYQGALRMVADEEAIPKTIDKILDVAEAVGGHIASRKDDSVEIKVPSASFRDAMTKIEAIGGVVGRSVTADDVSEEFHDLEVRLVNLRATRTRLQEFLAKAPNIQDMLTVERELERVAQEIDRMEGRLEFLRTRAAMSLISVHLAAKPKSAPLVITPPPPPPALRTVDIPVPWVGQIGIDPLLSLRK
jgi:hypothetical protein